MVVGVDVRVVVVVVVVGGGGGGGGGGVGSHVCIGHQILMTVLFCQCGISFSTALDLHLMCGIYLIMFLFLLSLGGLARASDRPSLVSTSAGPKAKAKNKSKKAKAIKDKPEKTTVLGGGGAGKKKDKELEELDMKRKTLVRGNKWADKIQALDVEVSFALEQADGIESCEEFLRLLLRNEKLLSFLFVSDVVGRP